MSSDVPATVEFENSIPILRVDDLDLSIEYYVRALGFRVDWLVPNDMASVSRGRGAVMLCRQGQGRPGSWVWFGVSDVKPLYAEFLSSGADVQLPPTNYPWALEIQVRDLDGHMLRFGSEPLENCPFSPWRSRNDSRHSANSESQGKK